MNASTPERLEIKLREILDDDDALSVVQILVAQGWTPPVRVEEPAGEPGGVDRVFGVCSEHGRYEIPLGAIESGEMERRCPGCASERVAQSANADVRERLRDVAAAAWGYRVAYEAYWGEDVPGSSLPPEQKQRMLGALVAWQQELDGALAAMDGADGDFAEAKRAHRETIAKAIRASRSGAEDALPGPLPVPVGDETEALRAKLQDALDLANRFIAYHDGSSSRAKRLFVDCQTWAKIADEQKERAEGALARVAGLEAREASLRAERDAFRIEADCGLRDYDDLELTAGNLRRALVEITGYVRSHLAGQDADPELKWALEQADSALADSGEAGREADSAKNAEIREDLHLAAIACDLYADEFPESIDEEDPERASEALHRASAWLCEQARWSESDEEAVEDERGRSRDL